MPMYMSPQMAWDKLKAYKQTYYDSMAAMYDGDHDELRRTAESGTFWARRNSKCKVHVPICSDIAMTSASLLFSKEPTYIVVHGADDLTEPEARSQSRLEDVLLKNRFANKLSEAAETAAALGDVYLKLRWAADGTHPFVDVVQPDCAWPEYMFGELQCVHFFTPVYIDYEKDVWIRTYECYERKQITMKLFSGSAEQLGNEMPDEQLEKMGYASKIDIPVDDMIAVHIANIRPNRRFRSSMMGRSDLDGLRDMCDALDETYSSWMRDIRLAKARLIVPAEYLRKKPQSMVEGLQNKAAYEFDADVETYVAMDIDTDRAGLGITPSQFEIRSEQHEKTCENLVKSILEYAGYSAQTFGVNSESGNASGTSLNIRQRKSSATAYKKQGYWQAPLENILTALVHLDCVLYPQNGSHLADSVSITYADVLGNDIATTASTIQVLYSGQSASTKTRVRMQHPEWSEEEINNEVDLIKQEFNFVDEPNMMVGDYDNPDAALEKSPDDELDTDESEETSNFEDGEE